MSWRTMRAWMEVDLDAIVRNAHAAKERAGVPLIPMLKADAYGLGAERVALALEAVEPLAYGVATVAEGKALRQAGIVRPLIVFTPLLPDEYGAAHELSLTPTLGSIDEISAWRSIGDAWHLSIDTGMSRAGAEWRDAGCSMCLGMNPDQLQPGQRCVSTSNRNFEGRQGRGGRTHLLSPPMAAAII